MYNETSYCNKVTKIAISKLSSHLKLSPGFHSFFITYLQKLNSNSEGIDVQASTVFENSAQNPAVLKPTKCSALDQSEMSNFPVCPIRIM